MNNINITFNKQKLIEMYTQLTFQSICSIERE